MTEDHGVISSFQQRRQLEDAIAHLATTTTDRELRSSVTALATAYPQAMLMAALVRNLGSSNSQLRGGLGYLAAQLPHDDAVNLLRQVVADRQRSPLERNTAALIMDRYLNAPAPGALLADLADDDEAPYQSLLEAVEEGRSNRYVLLEYVLQMQQHPAETAFMVMGLVDRLPAADRIELLRLMAQDARLPVVRAALDRLGLLAADEPRALRALHTLQFALPPARAEQVERLIRKLQFGGRRYTPPAADGWRALVTPPDAGGFLSIWLIQPTTGAADDGVLLGFVVSLFTGTMQFSGGVDMDAALFPPRHALGDVFKVEMGNGARLTMQEAAFDLGRWFLRTALTVHWAREQVQPLPEEYQLYNDLLWEFAAPQLDAALALRWAAGAAPDALPDPDTLNAAASALMEEPAMQSWLVWSVALWETVAPTARRRHAPEMLVRLVLRELAEAPEKDDLLRAMATGLRALALWFASANRMAAADQAGLFAAWFERLPVGDNPLLELLLLRGLQTM
jgi:hypothetical protein